MVIVSKQVALARFCAMAIMLSLATVFAWNYVSYGFAQAAQVRENQLSPPIVAARPPTTAAALDLGKALSALITEPEAPEFDPAAIATAFQKIAVPERVRICWRTGLLAGIDCWLVLDLSQNPLTPSKVCHVCDY